MNCKSCGKKLHKDDNFEIKTGYCSECQMLIAQGLKGNTMGKK